MRDGTGQDVLTVQVLAWEDGDDQELDVLTGRLQTELLDLDVDAVDRVSGERLPEDAKGTVAAVAGWLAVYLTPTMLRDVVNAVVAWAGRNNKSVEVSFGEHDVLKLTGVTSEQQQMIIDEWIARHAARA